MHRRLMLPSRNFESHTLVAIFQMKSSNNAAIDYKRSTKNQNDNSLVDQHPAQIDTTTVGRPTTWVIRRTRKRGQLSRIFA
jgi:hypothetical protein